MNGILLPGGAGEIKYDSDLFNTYKNIVDIAKEFNDKNDHFPIMGTCLGFEALIKVLVNDKSFEFDKLNDLNISNLYNLLFNFR